MKLKFYNLILQFILVFVLAFISSCTNEKFGDGFKLLSHKKTGIDFRNLLNETEDFNIFRYQYFYNGGGVSIADFNNDGKEDIFFSGNMVKNRLYLNKGNLEFENITTKSGVAKHEGWCTGSNAIDINQDGWMDIYVCRAGYPFPKLRSNLLFINNKDNTFTESAAQYGIDDSAYSTHSTFFDFDRDGDLDLFLVNHSIPEYSKGNIEVLSTQLKTDPKSTNKLFRNDNGKYIDVTAESKITSNVLSYSLGIAVLDINEDHFSDIYITNDFNEPDYIFINQQDGTFKESAKEYISNQSKFSMGVDFADIDNNGYQDIVTLDMLPESNFLQKMHVGADNFDKIEMFVEKGFQHQHMRNTLQLNTPSNKMSEVGQAMGISNTDWSWSPLFLDFDNDTEQDLFISNGYMRDHTDLDFLQYTADLVQKMEQKGDEAYDFESYVSSMPPINEPNYFYKKNGSVYYNVSKQWDLTNTSVSQGAAYADLDQDGDMDLVVSNSGDYAYVYENQSSENNSITISLQGSSTNIGAIGAKVTLGINGKSYSQYCQPSRGFQSSSTYDLQFGLGISKSYEWIKVIWPDGQKQFFDGGKCCERKILKKENTQTKSVSAISVSQTKVYKLDYNHIADDYKDFNFQKLMPFYQTDVGTQIEVADIDADGYEDIIIAGSSKNEVNIFYQNKNGQFTKSKILSSGHYISSIKIADINNDNKLDIILSEGNYAFSKSESKSIIHTLVQTSNRSFIPDTINLENCNPSSIVIADFDSDNEVEIFCGGDYWNGQYPVSSSSVMLDKNGNSWDLKYLDLGNVKSLSSGDIDMDNIPEILAGGHWSSPKIISFQHKKLEDISNYYIPDSINGFYNFIDYNTKTQSITLGNLGINNQLNATKQVPLVCLSEDIDKNGSLDPVMSYNIGNKAYPHPSREDIIMQVPSLKKKYLSFKDYANVDFAQFLNHIDIENPRLLNVHTLSHIKLIKDGNSYKTITLPFETQMAPIFDIETLENGTQILAGNKSKNLVKVGNLSVPTGKYWNPNNDKSKLDLHGLEKEHRNIALIYHNDNMSLVHCAIDGQLTIQNISK